MPSYYGAQTYGEALGNQRLGIFGFKESIKDRSDHTGTLLSVSVYIVGVAAYGAGTGGSVLCRVETDDGTGLPSGTLVSAGATSTVVTGRTNQISEFVFGTPVADVAGALRHFVFSAADASPTVNFVSIDNLNVTSYGRLPQPTISDDDRMVCLFDSGWAIDNVEFSAIFRTLYADGYKGGASYYETAGPRFVGGNQKVRLNFTPVSNRVVTWAHMAAARVAGTAAPLVANLRNLTSATLLDSASFAASTVNIGDAVSTGQRYLHWRLAAPVQLVAGTNYALEFTSTEVANPYMSNSIRYGGIPASFGALLDSASRFTEGVYEYSTDGSTWLTETGQSLPLFFFESPDPTRQVASWAVHAGGA